MSQLNSIDDSLASMSQDFDFQNTNPPPTPSRGRAVTLATMRGVINLFNHYFKQLDENGAKKKMTRVEKHRRWISYKQKIWDDYGRRITGTYASEAALIRRYSDPLTFLKYRLKRAKNLKIEDLSQIDQQYYKEIGGTDDVNQLINRSTNNIDSIRAFSQPAQKRQRPLLEQPGMPRGYTRIPVQGLGDFNAVLIPNVNNNSHNQNNNYNRNHNHNINRNQHANSVQIQSRSPSNPRIQGTIVPVNTNLNAITSSQNSASQSSNSKRRNAKHEMVDEAIDQVAGNMDIFEQEQLLKKKIEAFEMTQEKVRALMKSVKSLLSSEPQMIGAIPGIGGYEDQLQIFFDYWLNQNKEVILSQVESTNFFFEQLSILKMDQAEFQTFLQKWKLQRILENDSFLIVWKWMVDDLNISLKMPKEENDEEEEKTNDEDIDMII